MSRSGTFLFLSLERHLTFYYFVTVQPLRHKGTKKGYEYKTLSKRKESIDEKL